jgi:hypothetical protein
VCVLNVNYMPSTNLSVTDLRIQVFATDQTDDLENASNKWFCGSYGSGEWTSWCTRLMVINENYFRVSVFSKYPLETTNRISDKLVNE